MSGSANGCSIAGVRIWPRALSPFPQWQYTITSKHELLMIINQCKLPASTVWIQLHQIGEVALRAGYIKTSNLRRPCPSSHPHQHLHDSFPPYPLGFSAGSTNKKPTRFLQLVHKSSLTSFFPRVHPIDQTIHNYTPSCPIFNTSLTLASARKNAKNSGTVKQSGLATVSNALGRVNN